jgi:SAM-dependent methyltransferase
VSKQEVSTAGDPYDGREPTSHERQAGQPWDASYRGEPAPWDIGAPQPAVVRLASRGVFRGAVLDAGCGTGDNALHIAGLGLRVVGFDVAPRAVAIAREGAQQAAVAAEFLVADALRIERWGRSFDTVLDCALFHALDARERRTYVAGLASVTRPGGHLHLLCFAESDSRTPGPHPVSRAQLSEPFAESPEWGLSSISAEELYARFAPQGLPAWLAEVERRAG